MASYSYFNLFSFLNSAAAKLNNIYIIWNLFWGEFHFFFHRDWNSRYCLTFPFLWSMLLGYISFVIFGSIRITKLFYNFRYLSMIQIWVEIPHEPWNMAQSIQKCDLPFIRPVFKANKNPIWGEFCWGRPMPCVFSPQNWQKTTKIIKCEAGMIV